MLDRIGVAPGWRCADIGCGAGGIIDLLADRVAPTGLALGLDADPVLLEVARGWCNERAMPRVVFVRGDAYHPPLRADTFDLVHVRFLAGTAGLADDLLASSLACVRPGGVLAFQEPDTETLECHPPHPAWQRLKTAVQEAFTQVGADTTLARRLYAMFRHAGLEDVQYRPFLIGVTSTDPMVDFLPATAESLRATLLDRKLIDESELNDALVACRAHLAHPDTIFTTYLTAQVWGRKPGR